MKHIILVAFEVEANSAPNAIHAVEEHLPFLIDESVISSGSVISRADHSEAIAALEKSGTMFHYSPNKYQPTINVLKQLNQ